MAEVKNKTFKVKLTGAAAFKGPDGLGWKAQQVRTFQEGDARLPYYERKKQFLVSEDKVVSAPPKRPKKAAKPEKVKAPEPDLGEAEATPLAEAEPEIPAVDVDGPPESGLPSDDDLSGWKKVDLLELAEEWGALAEASMTKAEIRLEIDKIR